MDPDGMLNGWNSRVLITSAMIRAWNTTRPPSASPPSLRLPSVDTLIGLSSFELSIDFTSDFSTVASIVLSTACSATFLAISFTRSVLYAPKRLQLPPKHPCHAQEEPLHP